MSAPTKPPRFMVVLDHSAISYVFLETTRRRECLQRLRELRALGVRCRGLERRTAA